MANELRLAHTTTGEPIYAIVRNENGDPWNFGAGAFNTYDASNFSNYTLNMTEQGGSRYYHASMPAAAAGLYFAAFYHMQSFGAPVEGDPLVGQQTIDWRSSQTAQLNVVLSQLEQRRPTALVGGRIDASLGDIPTTPAGMLGDAILDHVSGIEPGFTLRQGLRIMLAALAGKLSGAGTTAITIRATNDSKSRIIAAVDASGNRSALFLDPS